MLIQENPALLHMENAMGQTPLELAEGLYIQYVTTTVPGIPHHHGRAMPTTRRGLEWLGQLMEREGGGDRDWEVEKRERTWRVCRDGVAGGGMGTKGRKLVSVSEAGEVARRLAEREKKHRMEEEEERAREAAAAEA